MVAVLWLSAVQWLLMDGLNVEIKFQLYNYMCTSMKCNLRFVGSKRSSNL